MPVDKARLSEDLLRRATSLEAELTMHSIPAMSMMSGELARTGVTILPMIITAAALLVAGLVLISVFSRRDR